MPGPIKSVFKKKNFFKIFDFFQNFAKSPPQIPAQPTPSPQNLPKSGPLTAATGAKTIFFHKNSQNDARHHKKVFLRRKKN